MKPDINPCPLCGGACVARLAARLPGAYNEYVVECLECQYVSEVGRGRKEAIEKHNRRDRE